LNGGTVTKLLTREHVEWILQLGEECRQRQLKRGSRLFLVPKPAPEPVQLDLDFDGESQREVERVIADVLERNRRPKVG
jgi:hypothetical protein